MKIILTNKIFKYHKLVFATDLIFCNNPKSHIGFLQRETGLMLTSWLSYKNTLTLAARLPNCGDVEFDVWFMSSNLKLVSSISRGATLPEQRFLILALPQDLRYVDHH